MPMNRAVAPVAGLVGLLALTVAGAAAAQGFPTGPVKFIVPYGAGGTDLELRAMAPVLERALGQPVQVENREGGGSSIGASFVARAPADGHTVLYGSSIVLTVGPKLRKVPYALSDFRTVAQATSSAHLMAARVGAPFTTLREMLAYARANPGKVAFGSAGTGSGVHMANEYFVGRAGIDVNHIPFNGVNQATAAAVGGNVDYVIGFPIAIMPQIDGGKMVALGQFSSERSPLLPQVPTLREQGVDGVVDIHVGAFVPKGTPDAVVKRLDDAFKAAVTSPEFAAFGRERWTVPLYRGAADFAKAIEVELTMYDPVLPKLGGSR